MVEAAVEVIEVDPHDPRVLAAQQQYVQELREWFPTGFEPGDLRTDLPNYRRPQGACLLAVHAGSVVGTAAMATLEPADDAVAPLGEIKRMWVARDARGLGLGRRLLDELEARARELGYATLRLDTQESLTAARRLYTSAGYRPTERYNDNPYATHFFEKSLR